MLYNQNWEKNLPVADLFNRAAKVLELRGHTKGRLVDFDGSVCALGALRAASAVGQVREAAVKLLAESIRPDGDIPSITIADWNNTPERTKEEVVAKFRELAVLAA